MNDKVVTLLVIQIVQLSDGLLCVFVQIFANNVTSSFKKTLALVVLVEVVVEI